MNKKNFSAIAIVALSSILTQVNAWKESEGSVDLHESRQHVVKDWLNGQIDAESERASEWDNVW